MELCDCVLIALIIYLIYKWVSKEGFLNRRPTKDQKEKYIDTILSNKEMFEANTHIDDAKSKFPWMDPVLFNDIKQLLRKSKLTKESISKYL